MRIVFFGSGSFAAAALEALLCAGHELALVCTRPPRRAGRGCSNRPTPVGTFAAARGLHVLSPDDPAEPEFLRRIREASPDVGVLADYARLLPLAVLGLPRRGFLNVHPSLLPRWRGAAPIARAIMAGDDVTGVCIMRMTERLDRGPVLMRREARIGPGDTAGSLAQRLAEDGAAMIVESLGALDRLEPLQIDQAKSCYARKIEKREAQIDWSRPARHVDCLIRGLSPAPGAWSRLRGERIKILNSRCEDAGGPPGQLLDEGLLVACGGGAVRALRLQRADRSPMDAHEFLHGFKVDRGESFDI